MTRLQFIQYVGLEKYMTTCIYIIERLLPSVIIWNKKTQLMFMMTYV